MGKVSFYSHYKNTSQKDFESLSSVLKKIRDGEWRDKIESLREFDLDSKEGKEDYDSEKVNLPGYVFGGTFEYRSMDKLIESSGFVCLDVDYKNNPERHQKTRERFKNDEHCLAMFDSPSGRGVKVIYRIPKVKNKDEFKEYWLAIKERNPEIDDQTKDLSRLCFVSYDKDLYTNKNAKLWDTKISSGAPKMGPEKRDVYEAKEVGSRNNGLFMAACELLREGKTERQTMYLLHEQNDRSTAPLLSEEIIKILKSAVKNEPVRSKQNEDAVGKRVENYIFNDDDQELLDRFNGKRKRSFSTTSRVIDKHFRFVPGHSVFFLARDNVGKTTMTLWLMAIAAKHHNWRWAVYSAENDEPSIKETLMQIYLDKVATKMTKEEFNLSRAWVAEHFIFIRIDELYSHDDMCGFLSELDVDGFFIDPWNAMMSPSEKDTVNHFYEYKALHRLQLQATKRNIALWITMHPHTRAIRDRHPAKAEIAGYKVGGLADRVYKEQAEGGSKFSNKAHDFVSYHRYISSDDLRFKLFMWVEKVKESSFGFYPNDARFPIVLDKKYEGFGWEDTDGYNPMKDYIDVSPDAGFRKLIEDEEISKKLNETNDNNFESEVDELYKK